MKWKKICDYFAEEATFSPSVRYKLINTGETHGFSEVWWNEVYECCETIEWIEFSKYKDEYRGALLSKREINVSDSIKKPLDRLAILYTDEGSVFKIRAYVKPKLPEL